MYFLLLCIMNYYLNISHQYIIIFSLLFCCDLDSVRGCVIVIAIVGLILGGGTGLVLGVDGLGFGVGIGWIILMLIFGHCFLVCIDYQLLLMLSS